MAAKTFEDVLKFNPYHDTKGRFASASGGGKFYATPGKSRSNDLAIQREKDRQAAAGGSAGGTKKMKEYIANLEPDVEYPERVEHWKKQIQAGNERPILVSSSDENRVIDGNHTLAAYKELGLTPKVYAMDRVEFLLGASESKDTVDFIRQAIKDGKATEVKKADTEENQTFSVFKTDDDKRLVFGWASISITVDGEQLEDRQKDVIDPEDLEEAAYEYVLNFRDTGEEHISSMRKKGKLVESCVFTAEKQKAIGIPEGTLPIGWWIGFKIEDDAAWEKVKNGTYRMFSIEGKANRIPVEKGQLKGCGVLVIQDGKILSGTRIERSSRGQICGPGGHIEEGEAPEEAAKREAWEEFGITCQELIPLGTLKNGSSAIFLCQKFTGTPETDDEEMTDLKWRTIDELREENLFRPFEESLELLDQVEKGNPFHDSLGRFTTSAGGGGSATRSAPALKSAKEFEDYVEKHGLKKLYRGYSADTPERLDEYENSIRSGKSSMSGEKTSALGKGVYFANDHTEAEGYMNRRKQENGDKYGRVTTAALDVGAKIGDFNEHQRMKFDAESELNKKAIQELVSGGGVEAGQKLADQAMEIRQMSVPEYAATKGFDALYDNTTGYTVVMNQNALVVKVDGVANSAPVAKTFDEVLKFNPFHDAKGRFSNSSGFASYSANPKTKAGAMAISRSAQAGHGTTFNVHRESQGENVGQNYKWLNGGPGAKQLSAQGQLASQQPTKPAKNYDKRGFADYDDADYHQLHSGRQYYAQQNLSATEKKAAANYLEAHAEPGSLYSHSQNMNYMMANGQTLTGKYKQTHDGMMSAMHNIGYNVELTRYDHAAMINGMLKSVGAGSNYEKMSVTKIKKALVGQTVNEDKFISASYNDFSNATNASVFTSRAVKINYRVKANTQAMMPGKGPGGDFGEVVLAPTNGRSNPGGKIVGVRLTGKMARRQGTQTYNQPQIEIDIEIG